MAIRIEETWDSRSLGLELDNARGDLEFGVIGTSDHLDAYQAALSYIAENYPNFEGLSFRSLNLDPLGGPNWLARVGYGVNRNGALAVPLATPGGVEPPPLPPSQQSSPGEHDPLTDYDGVYFTTVRQDSIHVNKSIRTVRRISLLGTKSATTAAEKADADGLYYGADVKYDGELPPDRGGVIGEDGEGLDLAPGPNRYTLTRNTPSISNFMVKRYAEMAGRTNKLHWKDFRVDQFLFLGVEGECTGPAGWRLTYYFDLAIEQPIYHKGEVVGVLPPHCVAWSVMQKVEVLGFVVLVPAGIYVEQVWPQDFFARLRI